MFNFLHNYSPKAVLFSGGFLEIHWYGFFLLLGFILSFLLLLFLAKKQEVGRNLIFDLTFYLFVFGIIGARIYDVFLEWEYYLKKPIDALKIWQGGLAIHGAILAGLGVLVFFTKKYLRKDQEIKNRFFGEPLSFFLLLSSLVVTVLPLGQAIGRWGNYFNQELFGRPSNSPWSIFIEISKRPAEYLSFSHFHPTFLYESLGCFFIFLFLLSLQLSFLKKSKKEREEKLFKNNLLLISLYLILYSILRFFLEFIRIDFAPTWGSWRWPQIMSVLIIIATIILNLIIYCKKHEKNKKEKKK